MSFILFLLKGIFIVVFFVILIFILFVGKVAYLFKKDPAAGAESATNGRGGFRNPFSQQSNNQTNGNHKEGEIYVSKEAASQKKVKENVGDYVDFEEVK